MKSTKAKYSNLKLTILPQVVDARQKPICPHGILYTPL